MSVVYEFNLLVQPWETPQQTRLLSVPCLFRNARISQSSRLDYYKPKNYKSVDYIYNTYLCLSISHVFMYVSTTCTLLRYDRSTPTSQELFKQCKAV